jgi:hypothetical protein
MLESFPDQLGKHMQIHEVTRPRKITEQGFLGGLASGLQGALSKVGIQGPAATNDPDDRFTGPTMNRAQALAAGQKTAATLMPIMTKDWAKAVQTAMAQSIDPVTRAPPTSAAQLTSGEQARLKAELVAMVNRAIESRGTFDYTRLPDNIGDTTTPEGQTTKATAMKTVQKIDQAIDAIFNATLDPKADIGAAWQQLTRDGIAPAQGIQNFDSNSTSSALRISPAAKKLTDQMRLDDGDIMKIRQFISTPGNDQVATAILDKKTPATAASPLIRQFAQQAKLSDAELASLIKLAQDAANDAAIKEIFGLQA